MISETKINKKPYRLEYHTSQTGGEWPLLPSSFPALLTFTHGKKGNFLRPPNLKEKAPWGREDALL